MIQGLKMAKQYAYKPFFIIFFKIFKNHFEFINFYVKIKLSIKNKGGNL